MARTPRRRQSRSCEIAVFEDRAQRPGREQPAIGDRLVRAEQFERAESRSCRCRSLGVLLDRDRRRRSCSAPGRAIAGRTGGNDPKRDAGRRRRDPGRSRRGKHASAARHPPASARRSAGSPARAGPTARRSRATSRWNSGKAPSTSSKATVIAKAAASAAALRFARLCGPSSSPHPPALRRDIGRCAHPMLPARSPYVRPPRGRPHRPARSS